MADEGEIKLLQQEVLGQLLEDAYAGKFVPDDVPTSRENRDSGAMIPEEASGNDFAEEVPGKRDREDHPGRHGNVSTPVWNISAPAAERACWNSIS